MPEDIVLRSTPEKTGAKHFPNPSNISPQEDTESDKSNVSRTSVKMDVSNPPPAQFIPHFGAGTHKLSKSPSPHFGSGIHKSLVEQ